MLKKVDFLLEKQYQLERERQTARRRVLQELARISASIAATLERDNGIDPIMGQQNNVDITR
jgi:uncharacterized membrane protein